MKQQFTEIMFYDIRRLREERKNNNWEMYGWLLNRTSARNDLAYELGIITFHRWKMLDNLIHA